MMQPDAIDQHAGGERVVSTADGPCEFESSAALLERLPVLAGDDGQKLPRHFGAGTVRIAPHEHMGIVGTGIVHQDHALGRSARMCRVQFLQTASQRPQFLRGRHVEQPADFG